MAQFPDMTPTTNGDKMLIQAVNGHKLVFTRGAFGSGHYLIVMISKHLRH